MLLRASLQDVSPLSVVALVGALILFTLVFSVIHSTLSNLLVFFRLRHVPQPSRNAFSLITTVFRSAPDKSALWFNSQALRTPVLRMSGFLMTTNVIALSPECVRLLSSMPDKFPKAPHLLRFLLSFTGGSSIFAATGAEHRRLRAVIAPPLRHAHIVQHLQQMFFREARAITTDLMNADQIVSAVRVGTFRVVMHACFGIDFIPQQEIDRIGRLYDVALQSNMFFILLRRFSLPVWLLTKRFFASERARDQMRTAVHALCERVLRQPDEVPADSLFAQMIAMKESSPPHDHSEQNENVTDNPLPTNIKSNEPFVTADELLGTVLSFLLAGQATTTLSVSWALYILSQDPDLQRRLHASLVSDPSISSKSDECLDALDQHSLLDGVVKETIRLYPPLNFIMRVVDSDTDGGASIEGVFLPNGTTVRIPVLALQTRPDIWGADALEFRPERWMGEHSGPGVDKDVEKQRKWAMCTFWHGSYGCVGQRFAVLEIKAFVWEILRQFEIRPVQGSPLLRRSVGGTLSGLKLNFIPRNG